MFSIFYQISVGYYAYKCRLGIFKKKKKAIVVKILKKNFKNYKKKIIIEKKNDILQLNAFSTKLVLIVDLYMVPKYQKKINKIKN